MSADVLNVMAKGNLTARNLGERSSIQQFNGRLINAID